jgi:signal peptidase II
MLRTDFETSTLGAIASFHLRLVPRERITLRVNNTVALIALAVSVVDSITKAIARHELGQHAVHLFGALWFRLQFNSGISFSLNQSGPLVTTVVTIVVAIVALVVGLQATPGLATVGFGLLLGGGIANVIDRLAATPHQVTDFVAVSSFPVFNMADVSITAVFVVLVISALRGQRLLGS